MEQLEYNVLSGATEESPGDGTIEASFSLQAGQVEIGAAVDAIGTLLVDGSIFNNRGTLEFDIAATTSDRIDVIGTSGGPGTAAIFSNLVLDFQSLPSVGDVIPLVTTVAEVISVPEPATNALAITAILTVALIGRIRTSRS